MTTSATQQTELSSSHAAPNPRGLSVSAKISLGFLTVLVLHISIAVLGHYGLKKARRDLDRYHTTQHQVQRYSQIDRVVTGLQRNVMLFAFTGYEGPEVRASLLQDELEELLTRVEKHAEDELEREAIDEMQQHLRSHREIFEAVIVDRAKRRELVDEVLLNCGHEFEAVLCRVREIHPQSGMVATADAEFQAAQLESLLFVNRPDSVHLREAKLHLANALRALQSLGTAEIREQAESVEPVQEAIEVAQRYENAFIQMVHATRGYLHLVNVVLAGESEEFRRLASDVRDEQTRRIDDLAHRMNVDRQRFQVASNIFSLVTIVLGIAAAWRIGREVAPPLNAITATFDGLASGKDCETIPGLGRGDELGRLAAAAQVFKNKAAETERLLLIAEEARAELKDLNQKLGAQTALANRMADEATAAARAKSEFLANMSHEIRTPMTAILGFADMLSHHTSEAELNATVDTIRRNGEHLLMIINDILDLSKIEAGKMSMEPELVDLREMTHEIASLVHVKAEAAGLEIETHVRDDVPHTILTDSTRLRQILINVIGNAIKFTKVGSVRLVVHTAADASDQALYFDVIDTGIGMSPSEVKGLFHPFWQADTKMTRRFGGTGLGLSISKRLAEMLGGKLEVIQTAPGQGSTFRLSLPMARVDQASGKPTSPNPFRSPTPVAQATPSQTLQGCRILLAEDGLDNQRLLRAILTKVGAEVVVVPNGREALTIATKQESQGTPFNCVLMDMQMPDMDGYEATSALRARQYAHPIIALTAHAMEGDAKKCLDAGCDAYLTKPIVREHFVQAVKYWADRSRRINCEGLAGSSY